MYNVTPKFTLIRYYKFCTNTELCSIISRNKNTENHQVHFKMYVYVTTTFMQDDNVFFLDKI